MNSKPENEPVKQLFKGNTFIKRMKRRSASFMYGNKRPSEMSMTRGNAEEEVEGIRNAIGDESDVEFDSQKYNECFINIYGFSKCN